MNKFFKKLALSLFFMSFASITSVCAVDNFNTVSQKFSLENKILKNESVSKKIENNITKNDNIIVQEYFMNNNLKCNYKYLKVTKNISYLDNINKKNIANSRIEYNFRYNTNTREAECLSSTYVLANYNDDYLLDISSKSLNKSTELGCAMSNINFTRNKISKKSLDKEDLQVTCDYQGKLDFLNIN